MASWLPSKLEGFYGKIKSVNGDFKTVLIFLRGSQMGKRLKTYIQLLEVCASKALVYYP